MRSLASALCPERARPSNRSGSMSARNDWKSSSLPLCGVAVSRRKWRGVGARPLPMVVGLRRLRFVAVPGAAHLVRLVAHDEVPLRLAELRLDLLAPAQVVETRDHEIERGEGVPAQVRLDEVVGDRLEGQVELRTHLLLPLFRKATRTDNET